MIINNQEIKQFAEEIALEYPEIETNLERIVEEEGIKVFYDCYDTATFDGMTIYEYSQFFIHINLDRGNKPSTARARFTLAHELGHYFIDTHRIGLKEGILEPHPSKLNNHQFTRIEREADYFASNLLMPETRFKKFINKKHFNPELLNDLKLNFNVSLTACAIRYADIGNCPLMIVYSENGNVKWKYYSLDFPYKYLLYEKKVPENTVMGEYFNKVHNDSYKIEKIWAVDIFNHVSQKDFNLLVNEYCISYKSKTLSIIWF
ncbi:ImmA/IrrE family metallo-endopeptidase [Zunongwangia sp. HGR-M22]|uniref:ImmA/IrrE family metallo-endopeptidase n=1 Tax=Zunongwangia sp. HGR-M22 TaxID=3015168 RepID=UPI0022DDA5AB|nr:ImmA/IrrE family metallo-endopeptidase [Zunongwangia sp. HGR-M22]WBL26770.1 ImmA/IrrE family metallo-endopeptidase [Zunongwangia sp. HGR-M22]